MSLKLDEAPSNWQERIREEAQRLLASAAAGDAGRLEAGEPLEASNPIPVYRLSSRDVENLGVPGRREVRGWRSLLFSRDRPEKGPVAVVSFEPREGKLKV